MQEIILLILLVMYARCNQAWEYTEKNGGCQDLTQQEQLQIPACQEQVLKDFSSSSETSSSGGGNSSGVNSSGQGGASGSSVGSGQGGNESSTSEASSSGTSSSTGSSSSSSSSSSNTSSSTGGCAPNNLCNGVCTDISTDLNNCGMCDHQCDWSQDPHWACNDGNCQYMPTPDPCMPLTCQDTGKCWHQSNDGCDNSFLCDSKAKQWNTCYQVPINGGSQIQCYDVTCQNTALLCLLESVDYGCYNGKEPIYIICGSEVQCPPPPFSNKY